MGSIGVALIAKNNLKNQILLQILEDSTYIIKILFLKLLNVMAVLMRVK